MKYAALMFDIIESRKYQDRFCIQNILMESITYLNYIYRDGIKKDVIPSAGDEFQGLFTDLQTAFLYARKLQLLIYPIKIRTGIGYGEIKYDVNEWSSSAFDGEAYYLARDAINAVPKRSGNVIFFNTNSSYDKYLNMYCLSIADIKSKQSKIVRWIELLADILMPIKHIDEDIKLYNLILKTRGEMIELKQLSSFSSRTRELEIFNTNFEILFKLRQSYRIADETGKKQLSFNSFWMHGMSTDIAEIMCTSRQNIDRYIILGKVKESRTMDMSIVKLLEEVIC